MMRGFTILETAIVIGILLATLGALITLYLSFNRVYGYEQVYAAVAGSASESLSALESAILPADAVLSSHAFPGITLSSATTSLVLELPSVDASGNIVAGAKDYIGFYASSTLFYRIVAASAQSARVSGTTQLSGTLSTVSFTYDNADLTKVTNVIATVSMLSQYKQQTASTTLREKLYLRN